jgi:MFS family permease
MVPENQDAEHSRNEPNTLLAELNAGRPEPPYPPAAYSWYVVGVLMVVYVFSFMDRQILGLLVGPIKRDLDISDTQFSYLMGLSFAVFYTFFGIPIGRLADSISRRGLIVSGLFFWSLMTAGCGLASHYWHFLLLRMGVGIGEASLSPAAYSMISDSFPRHRLATAISVYSMGIYIGTGLSYVFGGLVVRWIGAEPNLSVPFVGEMRSWQIVFFALGLPGLALALVFVTVEEPIRRGVRRISTERGERIVAVSVAEVGAYLRHNWKTLACHNVGFALLSLSSYGTTSWIPAFFQRTHGWEAANVGVVYGAIVALFGTSGIVFGGWLADRMERSGTTASKMYVGLLAALVWASTGIAYLLVPSGTVAMLLLVPTVFFVAMPFGVAPAAIQEMMPNTMRGQASAVYLFIVNLIGLGLGPSAIAWVTDFGFRDEAMLRYSILIVTTAAHALAAILLWLGIKHFRQSTDRRDEWEATQG